MAQQDKEARIKIREPFTIVVHFLLAGIVVLFLGLTYGYLFQMGQNWLEFKLPKVFWLSTISILTVSFFLQRLVKLYDNDKRRGVRRNLLGAFVFACFFVYCQLKGWLLLQQNEITLQTSPSSSYLYLLTGLHGLHVLVGIIFLMVAVFRAYMHTTDEIKTLLYFNDPARRVRLKLLKNYWHTIDFLWVFLFLVFLYRHA